MTNEKRDMLLSNMNTNLTNQAAEINRLSDRLTTIINVINGLKTAYISYEVRQKQKDQLLDYVNKQRYSKKYLKKLINDLNVNQRHDSELDNLKYGSI